MPAEPSAFAVTPSSVADLGRRLVPLQQALESARAHLAGPRPAPPVGDARCAVAYQGAAEQLAGVTTSAVEHQGALARAVTAAAALYADLDGGDSLAGR